MQPEVRMPELKAAANNVKLKPMKCCNRAPLAGGMKPRPWGRVIVFTGRERG
jgi:hypothetical protein